MCDRCAVQCNVRTFPQLLCCSCCCLCTVQTHKLLNLMGCPAVVCDRLSVRPQNKAKTTAKCSTNLHIIFECQFHQMNIVLGHGMQTKCVKLESRPHHVRNITTPGQTIFVLPFLERLPSAPYILFVYARI